MTTELAVGDILCFRFTSFYRGQQGLNIKFAKVTAVTSPGMDLEYVTLTESTFYATPIHDLMTSGAMYEGLRTLLYRGGALYAEAVDTTAAINGIGGADPLPTQVRGLITLKTPNAGRSQRGRMYLPFPDNAHQDPLNGGEPTAAYIAIADTIGVHFSTTQTITSGGLSATIMYGIPDYPVIPPPPAPPPKRIPQTMKRFFTSTVPSTKWATQRKSGDFGRLNPPGP